MNQVIKEKNKNNHPVWRQSSADPVFDGVSQVSANMIDWLS